MRAVAHGWKPDRMKGPSRKVAKEFVAADKKAKGYQYGGLSKRLKELQDTRTAEERMQDRYGTEPLTIKQAGKRTGKKGPASFLTAVREMEKAGWTQAGEKFYPPQATAGAPTEGGLAAATQPERTIQPVAGREFISGAAPPRQVAPAAPARTAAEIAPGFQPGRIPPALVQYLQSLQGAEPEPVKAQYGGFMNRMQGRGRRGFGGSRGQPQPPGGGMATSDMGMRAGQARRGQPGGGGSPIQGFIDRGGIEGRQLRRPGGGGGGVGQGQPRPQPPGAGVPLRGVGRPPGMGRPSAGGVRPDVMPGRGFTPDLGGGAGMPGSAPPSMRGLLQQKRQQEQTGGGRPRVGMADQQGGQARALQVQTGRPPMSRRQGFPGRSGRGRFGGRGRVR